ncbi:hypothetical protein [Pseudozobellia sp. WGM2]|uniref:hypothetical protein n=1 Tax=Pseudozobellia sp. WGM2 TaxID=2787625 RepID=UPI001ADF9D76|nr:hypothetical protein [Pseudozobellia sp. WGM2]
MNSKLLLFLYFSIVLNAVAYAQAGQIVASGNGVNNFTEISSYTSGIWSQTSNSDAVYQVMGSPFLFEDWKTKSILVAKNNKKFKLSKVNYDAKLDQIVAKISNDSIFYFNPAGIEQVLINNRVFERYLDPELERNSYYEVIAAAENTKLLKRFTKVIKEGMVNPMTQKKQTRDSYILQEKYFVLDEGKVNELKLKRKRILKLFDEKATRVSEYIKENHLSVKDDKDLSKIFNYYESI